MKISEAFTVIFIIKFHYSRYFLFIHDKNFFTSLLIIQTKNVVFFTQIKFSIITVQIIQIELTAGVLISVKFLNWLDKKVAFTLVGANINQLKK